jgi:hypothetical protein
LKRERHCLQDVRRDRVAGNVHNAEESGGFIWATKRTPSRLTGEILREVTCVVR